MAKQERTTEPRKRPRQARSKATVEAILEATARILRSEGYAGLSTNKAAKLAGVSVGSLYQYFPNKTALVTALVEQHAQTIRGIVAAGFIEFAGEPLPTVARKLVAAMLEAHAIDPILHIVLTEQVPRGDEHACVQQEVQIMEQLLHAFLVSRQDELRQKDLKLASFVVVQMVEAVTHRAIEAQPDRLQDGSLEDELVDLLVRYLVPDAE